MKMKRVVMYKAIDQYYSDVEQTYIGATLDEIESIQAETEEFMGHNHPNGINNIYEVIITSEE